MKIQVYYIFHVFIDKLCRIFTCQMCWFYEKQAWTLTYINFLTNNFTRQFHFMILFYQPSSQSLLLSITWGRFTFGFYLQLKMTCFSSWKWVVLKSPPCSTATQSPAYPKHGTAKQRCTCNCLLTPITWIDISYSHKMMFNNGKKGMKFVFGRWSN